MEKEPFGSNGWKLGLVTFATVPVVKVIGGRNGAAADFAMYAGKPSVVGSKPLLEYPQMVMNRVQFPRISIIKLGEKL